MIEKEELPTRTRIKPVVFSSCLEEECVQMKKTVGGLE
jgi:hypothetical protein